MELPMKARPRGASGTAATGSANSVGRGLREGGLEVPVKAGPQESIACGGDADGARTFRAG